MRQLLQRLLDDRRPTVELIKKEGGKMSELAEPADREKIVGEISGLGQRWDTLLRKAETRSVPQPMRMCYCVCAKANENVLLCLFQSQ